jgi:hypothetical protein
MKLFFWKKSNNVEEQLNTTEPMPVEDVKMNNHTDDIAAAISLAVHLYMNKLQEYENNMITFQQLMKPYSPWSSKIYGLRQVPMYRPGTPNKIG